MPNSFSSSITTVMWPIESQPGVDPIRNGVEGSGAAIRSARTTTSWMRCSVGFPGRDVIALLLDAGVQNNPPNF